MATWISSVFNSVKLKSSDWSLFFAESSLKRYSIDLRWILISKLDYIFHFPCKIRNHFSILSISRYPMRKFRAHPMEMDTRIRLPVAEQSFRFSKGLRQKMHKAWSYRLRSECWQTSPSHGQLPISTRNT